MPTKCNVKPNGFLWCEYGVEQDYEKRGDMLKTRHPEWSALIESVMVEYDEGMLFARIFSFQVIASPHGGLRCGRAECSGECTDRRRNR